MSSLLDLDNSWNGDERGLTVGFIDRMSGDHAYDEATPLIEKAGSSHNYKEPGTNLLKSTAFGVLLVILSAISYGVSASVVSMEADIATPLIVASRFLGTFLFTAIGCMIGRVDLRVGREHIPMLVTRSIFGLISFVCGTYAFQNMPVGEATVLVSMAPVFVAIFSSCFLGERPSWVTVILIILSVGGVALIVDPDELAQGQGTLPKLNLIAAAAAVTQAIAKAISYIFIKRSSNKIHFMTMIFWYSLFGTLFTTLFILTMLLWLHTSGRSTSWVITKPDSNDYICLAAISTLGFISQITLTKATQTINTTIVSLIRNTDILVAMAFQILYFRLVPCYLQIIGMVIMVLSTLLILISNERQRVLAQHPRCF